MYRIIVLIAGILIVFTGCTKEENLVIKNPEKLSNAQGVHGKRVIQKVINKQDGLGYDLKKFNSPFRIRNVNIKGNTLAIQLYYGGGCAAHKFILVWNGKYLESKPQQVYLRLYHNSNNDKCEARINDTINFHLSSLLPCIITVKGDKIYYKKLKYRIK